MKLTIQPYLGLPINKSHPLAQGLVGCWMLNEGGGLRARDSTRLNQFDGALTNCVFQQSANGNCVNFNGTTSYIDLGSTVANYPNLNLPGGLTIIASINSTTVSLGDRSIVSDFNSGSTLSQYHLALNRVAAKLTFAQGGASIATSTGSLTANTWFRVGATRSGTTNSWNIKFYINGRLDSTTNTATNPVAQQGLSIGRIGQRNLFFFSGLINKVMIYNRTLTDSEMAQDFTNPLAMFINKRNMLVNA